MPDTIQTAIDVLLMDDTFKPAPRMARRVRKGDVERPRDTTTNPDEPPKAPTDLRYSR